MEHYIRGYTDGENVRAAYDSRGDERTVPDPDLRDKSPLYKKGWWDGFNKLDMCPPETKPDWLSPEMKSLFEIK